MERRKIVDSMTVNEILQLYAQEVPFVDHQLEVYNKRFSKMLRPFQDSVRYFPTVELKRNSGLNIVLQYFDKGCQLPKAKRLGLIYFFWFIHHSKVCVLRPLILPRVGFLKYFYTSHFIERYRERVLKDSSITKPMAINLFLRNNMRRLLQMIPSKKHPQNGWMCCEEGIAYASFEADSTIIVKTFVSWDNLSATRKDITKSMIEEATTKGINFDIPEELLDEDINTLDAL